MFRMWLMTFTGKPRDQHVYEHAHESPRTMTVPLIVLAVFSVCVAWGWPFFSSAFPFLNAEASWLEHQLHHSMPMAVQADFGGLGPRGGEVYLGTFDQATNSRLWAMEYHHLAGNLALGMVVLGMVFAFVIYYWRTLEAPEGQADFPGVRRFLEAKWYFDELYSAALVRPSLAVARWCKSIDLQGIDRVVDGSAAFTVRTARGGGRFDNGVIDGLVNLVATVAYGIAGWFRSWQTGYLRSYVLFLALAAVGLFVLLSYFMA
jgi:NADH-quinone oxidoreductase subunit L